MSEFPISKKEEFGLSLSLSCIVLHLLNFFFFLLSHPLYFSYFIFIFPYFLKLLSFLSPLFITTFLLVFAFFSLFLSDSSKMGFLATTYQVVFDSLRPRTPEEIDGFPSMEELEAYKIVFESYTFGIEQNPYARDDCQYNVPEVEVKVDCEEILDAGFDCEEILDVGIDCEEILDVGIDCKEILDVGIDCEAILDVGIDCKEILDVGIDCAEILDVGIDCEEILDVGIDCNSRTEEVEQGKIEIGDSSTKAIENEMMKDLRKLREESSISSSPWSSPGSFSRENSLGSYGSMRKEKEWRRTLACKLFEERHNSEGTEGMDSLWETYEKSESKKLQKKEKIKRRSKKEKKIEEEEEDREGQFCCLQALKFSAGKTNLVKMSKALKGFGWLSRNGSRKRFII